ncbi:MAG TPA: NADH-quinone oxidoreductase subunit NuoE [Nitrospiraceae bacterium]|nr:NADH-quinone oxidoreductase subunit NuoE [Nitrospiraceae bacterium]
MNRASCIMKKFMLSESAIKELDEIRARYPTSRAALLPALYVAQRESGWLSPGAMEYVAQVLNMPKAVVRGVASFYAMYKHRPMGRHLIQLCTNVSCMILGAERLVDFLKDKYGLEEGSTTSDGRFSLVIMECIGGCDVAPSMLVDSDYYGSLTEETIAGILEKYK